MRKRIGSILGLLLCAAMAFGQGQAIERDSQTLTNTSPQPAGTKPFVQIDNRLGTGIVSIAYNFGGTIGTSSIVLKGCMRPGTAGLCDTLETNTATTDSKRTVTGLYDWYTVTPTFTGGTNPVVNVNWTMIPGGVASGNSIYTGSTTGTNSNVQGVVATGAAGASVQPAVVGGLDASGNVAPLRCGVSAGACAPSIGAIASVPSEQGLASIVIAPLQSGNAGATLGGLLVLPNVSNGVSLNPATYCGSSTVPAVINPSTATTTLLIAATAAKKNRLCNVEIASTGAQTVKIIAGTQTTTPCDTGAVTLTPTYQLAANTNLFIGGNFMPYTEGTATNQQICAVTSAAISVFVSAHYALY